MDKRIQQIRKEYDVNDSAKSLILDMMNISLINRDYPMVLKCIAELKVDMKTSRITEDFKESVITAISILEDVMGDVQALEKASDAANDAYVEIQKAIIILNGGLNAEITEL
jgi:hypothetical protein